MKQLFDKDIESKFSQSSHPNNDESLVRRLVREQLKLSKLIPQKTEPVLERQVLDLHGLTEQQAWDKIDSLLESGAKQAIVITGASGILKIKFIDWTKNSVIAHKIVSVNPINNGSFRIIIRK